MLEMWIVIAMIIGLYLFTAVDQKIFQKRKTNGNKNKIKEQYVETKTREMPSIFYTDK